MKATFIHEKEDSFTPFPPNKPHPLNPCTPLRGNMELEQAYVQRQTLDTLKYPTDDLYHPHQIHWVVPDAIIPIFRLVCLFVLLNKTRTANPQRRFHLIIYGSCKVRSAAYEVAQLEKLLMRAFNE